MGRVRTVMIAALVLAIVPIASAQERFLFDNLTYTPTSPAVQVGPVTFTETQFPVDSVINERWISALNLTPLPQTMRFAFNVYEGPSLDATVIDVQFSPFVGLSDHVIEGTSAGVLGIDFGTDVTTVSFAFALQTFDSVASACTLTAFDADGNQVGSSTASADPLLLYSEGENGFTSSAGFRRVEIAFANPFPPRIPALGASGLALLAFLVGLAGALPLRRSLL
jgi:hypothetical protein